MDLVEFNFFSFFDFYNIFYFILIYTKKGVLVDFFIIFLFSGSRINDYVKLPFEMDITTIFM